MKKSNAAVLRKVWDFLMPAIGYFSFSVILYYVIFIAKGYYHSDCTDTIMWAQASYDAHALMNPDFAYAGLMPFGGQLIMLPFVALFGVGLKAQIIGMAVFCILFTGSIVFLCKAMQFNYKWISFMVTSVLIIVSASEKLREIFWGHIIYYSLGLFFLMMGFGIVLKIIKNGVPFLSSGIRSIKDIKWYILLFLWTSLTSMNGVQSLTIYGLPVLAAVIAEWFFDFKTSFKDKKNINRFFVISIMAAGIFFGLLLGKLANGDIVAGYANAYSEFSVSSEWVSNFLDFFSKFFTLLGVKIKDDMLIYSFEGIINLLRIIGAVTLLIVPVIMVFLYRKFEDISYRLMILIHHFLVLLIMLGWIFGRLSSANWRLSPVVCTSVILCVMFIKWIFDYVEYKRLIAIVLLPVMCLILITTRELFIMDKQSPVNAQLNGLSEFLKENELEYGYATFWNANIVTLLSDSKVKVRDIRLEDDGYEKRLYQTNQNWYENVRGYDKYFVILSESEYEEYYLNNSDYEEADEILSFGNYKIMVYNHNIFE